MLPLLSARIATVRIFVPEMDALPRSPLTERVLPCDQIAAPPERKYTTWLGYESGSSRSRPTVAADPPC